MSLFEPLASKIRPLRLTDFIGQEHLVGPDKPLNLAIKAKSLFSMILYGPPGVGKTTLAKIYSRAVGLDLFELSAVSAGKDQVRQVVKAAQKNSRPAILFLDEIHRFNKAQQDYLLPFVETGTLYLIGATTENPSFTVISPLLSRCRVYVLHQLSEKELSKIISRAVKNLSPSPVPLNRKASDWLIAMANGDAR
ncbi:AAA family ATPase, partial [Candidatus Collierbacteria bacterium]|nr:AAA family ATPase [Candidatus Collierbacteria bacterium]